MSRNYKANKRMPPPSPAKKKQKTKEADNHRNGLKVTQNFRV